MSAFADQCIISVFLLNVKDLAEEKRLFQGIFSEIGMFICVTYYM